MTISYSGNFLQLLFRWKGSIWRSVWKQLLLYLLFFYIIRVIYLFGFDLMLNDADAVKWRTAFEAICRRFDGYTQRIPLTFVLGFYVSNVVSRWWTQFETLPWPEDLISHACATMRGKGEKTVRRRHLIARYINLSSALAWRDISSKIRMRFPSVKSLIAAGLLTSKEYAILEDIHKSCETLRWMTPLHWVAQLLGQEEDENKLVAPMVSNFVNELKLYRNALRRLFCYDWVCVPLVYTQVTAMATYSVFIFALFGRQTLIPDVESGEEIDLGVPILLIVQFLFFVGWFQVGHDLMRPFGTDDDDIELNYILDRNIRTSFTLTSRLAMSSPPEFEEDLFWNNKEGKFDQLPHTNHSSLIAEHRPKLHSYIELDKDGLKRIGSIKNKGRRMKKHIGW